MRLSAGTVGIQCRQDQVMCDVTGPGGTDPTVVCASCLGTFLSFPTYGLMEDSLRLTKGQGNSADVARTGARRYARAGQR